MSKTPFPLDRWFHGHSCELHWYQICVEWPFSVVPDLCRLTFFGLFHKSTSSLPLWTFDLALICGLCNTIFSPILYAYRSKRVQRDVKRTFGCKIFKVKKGCDIKANPRKLQRLKSLSCPQLLISSANENENDKTFNSLIASNTSFEKEPMICNKPKLSVFDVNQKLILQ